MTTTCRSLRETMTSLLLVALIPLAIVQADVVVIPTPFLVATARHSSSKAFLSIARGGSDRPSFEEEYDNGYDEETLDLSAADTDSLTAEEYDHEEFEVDMTEVAEEEETEAEEELEEVTLAEVFQDSFEEEEEVFEDALQDDQGQEEVFEEEAEEEPLAQVYEERMATDDDSSAFVDPMELADAYDEGETTAAGDDHSVQVATGGNLGSDQVDEEEAPAEITPDEAAETSEVVTGDEDAITEITEEQKKILMNFLKYKSEDIKVMRPEIALLVLAHSLRRPIEGMPANWYIEGASPLIRAKALARAKAVNVALTIVAVGVGIAIGVQGDMDLSQLTDQVSAIVGKIPVALAAIPAALSSKSPSKKTVVPAAKTASALAIIPVPSVADEEVSEPEEDKPEYDDGKRHSIKPSVDHSRLNKEDLDMSWLDKGITKFENFFKALFSIKI